MRVPTAVVVGAGIFGASLAHRLRRRDWDVALVDQYPPGHVRAASGDESRLIRFSHGPERWYSRSAWRARELWRELEQATGAELLVETGLLWLAHRDGGWHADSERVLSEEQIPVERLTPDQVAARFPDFAGEDLMFALHEPHAGVLRARDATRTVFRVAVEEVVRFLPGSARPAGEAVDVGGDRLTADRVVWACGAWLARLFPALLELRVTKQDVYYLGAPVDWQTPPVPAWIDYDHSVYGLGDLDGRGVKVASDLEGPPFDPDADARQPSPASERAIREYVARRFPALARAPVVGTRTCPYALTRDTNFIVAPHPEHESVWFLGGGSGHGFKHGPALGVYVASVVAGDKEPDERFALGRRGERLPLRAGGPPSR